ncbi:MAG: helix-turn-helix domain-containing protein [Anaeroplasmataceae bacterium]|nr:helix-turn-helix domain-containing protein [Anaeroplasmataceae bacterium]
MKTRLSELLDKKEIKRKVIAKDLGIEKRTLDNYVNEITLMNSDVIVKIAKYLNVSTDYLLGVDQINDDFLNQKIDKISCELKEIVYHLNSNQKS